MTTLLAMLAIGQSVAPLELALEGRDPIELARGVDVRGFAQFHATYGAFRYHFTSKENQAKFNSDPEQHGLQIGGACGSMGPLSGRGRGAIFAVVGGQIWQFASLQCRTTFLKNPNGYMEDGAGPSHSTEAEQRRGKAVLESAVKAHGGQKAFANLSRIVTVQKIAASSGKEADAYYVELGYDRSRGWMQRQFGTGWAYHDLVHGDRGVQWSSSFQMPLVRTERDYLKRLVARNPILLLSLRNTPGFVASAVELAEQDGEHIQVDIHFLDDIHVLEFDRKTNKLVQTHCRRRAGGPNRWVTTAYANWTKKEGILLPRTVMSNWEGKEGGPTVTTFHDIRINQPADAARFTFPK